MIKKRLFRLFIGIVLLNFLGCASHLKQRELERVAKDWALTIRASQVIPVYPLTADMQPGDIFLVQTPISKETATYLEKGFLALDLLYARLNLKTEYERFYKESYWEGNFSKIPFERPSRESTTTAPGNSKLKVPSPSVSFPNYTFNISAGGGLQLAIPISSVPIGLGIMGSNTATGSVELKETYTYGLSVEEMNPKLEIWAAENKLDLHRLAHGSPDPIFLRVVNRVFLVGRVIVSLSNADTKSAGLDVAAAKPIDLLSLQTDDPVKIEQNAQAYKKASETYKGVLNDLTANIPGGSIRVAQASRRSITLEETFDELKAIGYLGFDVLINEDGSIGPVMTTFQRLEGKAEYPKSVAYGKDENSDIILKWLKADPENKEALQEWLKNNLYLSSKIRATHIIYGNFPGIRKMIVKELIEKNI